MDTAKLESLSLTSDRPTPADIPASAGTSGDHVSDDEEESQLDLDIHELSGSYRIYTSAADLSRVSVHLSSHDLFKASLLSSDAFAAGAGAVTSSGGAEKSGNSKPTLVAAKPAGQRLSFGITRTTTDAELAQGTVFCKLDIQSYPNVAPVISANFDIKAHPVLQSLILASNVHPPLFDLAKIGYEWRPDSSNLVDCFNALNAAIEIQLQPPPLTVRDYAYLQCTAAHWGRYQLTGKQLAKSVRAIYDFQAADENELAFDVGDVIEVIYERDDGWLVGMMNGLSGLVPINHIEWISSADGK